jgi:hypothetical protein
LQLRGPRGLEIADGLGLDLDHAQLIDFVGNHQVFLERLRTLLSLGSSEPGAALDRLHHPDLCTLLRDVLSGNGERAASVNKLTRAFLAGDVDVGDRHRMLYSAAANLAELGCPLPAVRALLTEPALDLGLPPKDVARAVENGHAAAHPFVAQVAEVFGGTVTRVVPAEPKGGTT